MKTENYNIDSIVEMPVFVSQNDSIGCSSYESFKFVTETSRQYEGPIEREVTYISAAWNFVILFVVLIFMVLNKFMSNQRLVSVISMTFQNGGGERVKRENQSFFTLASFSVIASFVLLISLFVQKVFVVYGGTNLLYDNFDIYFDIAICVSAVFVFNYLMTYFYGWLFKADLLVQLHSSFYVSSMATCNLLLMPIILLLFFHPYKIFLIFTLIIIGLFYLMTFIKILTEVRMLSKLNFVNIFLYLCTIEILPILVISKMIVNVL